MYEEISILIADDWHLHLRDGELLKHTVRHVGKSFARAIVMPNTNPPICTSVQAIEYYERIMSHMKNEAQYSFEPLMTLYLHENLKIDEIKKISQTDCLYAVKFYPANATTNSAFGLACIEKAYPVLEEMQKLDIPLLVHGEDISGNLDIFDREASFVSSTMTNIVKEFPDLRIVLEHISTKEARDFILESSDKVACTITPQHLLLNRNALLKGGLRPHLYCMPILNEEKDRIAILEAATSGNKKFFAGTDSAPHVKEMKENHCSCAGIFSSPIALELYTHIFDEANALDKLEDFVSKNGASFYKLPYNTRRVTLARKSKKIPLNYPLGESHVTPLLAGETIEWTLLD